MRIDTGDVIQDIFDSSDQTSAAFIHECVHFLYDLTTIYGIRDIIMVVDFIKTVNIDQRKSETRSMKVPYQIDKAKIRGANYNGSIQRLLTGNCIDGY